jgi:adenylate cyclase
MDLPAPLAWLVDEAGASPGPDRFLAELGGRLLADGLPLAGGALTLAVPIQSSLATPGCGGQRPGR